MKQEFYFDSQDGKNTLHGTRWEPEGKVRAVLQIVHGMAEHIERYDEFASYLARRGVLVVGHSHLGHGKTAKCAEDLGYFAEPDGNGCVLGDIHALRKMTQQAYPGVPYFILGHSMGSFLTRQYLGLHGEGLTGAVIMGTGDIPVPVLVCAKGLCRVIAMFKGWRHRSALVDSFVNGGFEKKLGMGWLSKNEENVRQYVEDPFCGFRFTLNGFYGLFSGLECASRTERAGQIPDIRIHFCAGAEDPVGGNGKGVEAVYRRYLRQGVNATLRLYPGDRHEILKEDDRVQVFKDMYRFILAGNGWNK